MFCSLKCRRATCATSSGIHGSVGLAPTFRKSEPDSAMTSAAARIQRSVQFRYSGPRHVVAVAPVLDAEVVGRGRDHHRNRPRLERRQHVEAVAEVEPQTRTVPTVNSNRGRSGRGETRARAMQRASRHGPCESTERSPIATAVTAWEAEVELGRPGAWGAGLGGAHRVHRKRSRGPRGRRSPAGCADGRTGRTACPSLRCR